jgi:putative flippase GtrA
LSARELAARWLRFNFVGLVGIGVQLAALALYARVFGWHYLAATALAVETAVLHNFAWHERWTWSDRTGAGGILGRMWRFHLGNGLVSVAGNVALMKVLAGWFGLPLIPANLMAIAIVSIANFLLGEFWVYRRPA